MMDSQKKWRDEQKKAGNKLLSFWFTPGDIERIDNLMNRLELKSRADLIRRAVDVLYSQGEPDPFHVRLDLLEKRVDAMEAAHQKKPAAVLSEVIGNDTALTITEKKRSSTTASYDPGEVKKIIVEMDDQEAGDIAKYMNDKGITTVRGLSWSVNTVNKARLKIRQNKWG